MNKIVKLIIINFCVISLFFISGCKKEVTTGEENLDRIEITSRPLKTQYHMGETLDITGMVVIAFYDTGRKEDVTSKVIITGFNSSQAKNSQKITVKYNNKSDNFTVKILAAEISSIEITKEPTKTTYYETDSFEIDGMEVIATYTDGSKADVTSYVTINDFDSSVAKENQVVTVIYKEKTDTFNVKILALETIKIEITKKPLKTQYYYGDTFDITGMEVIATYNNGKTEDVVQKVNVSGFNSSILADNQEITVTYNNKTATFSIKILSVELDSIEVAKLPLKTEFLIGTAFNTTGMQIDAVYNNGAREDVTALVSTSGYNSSVVNSNLKITVIYNNKETYFNIKINDVYQFHDNLTILPEGTDGSGGTDYIYGLFGDFPQDVVPIEKVELLDLETSTTTIQQGYLTYVLGNDGNYYVKSKEDKLDYYVGSKLTIDYYSDGSDIWFRSYYNTEQSYRWFKVMPIKWRVIYFTKSYDDLTLRNYYPFYKGYRNSSEEIIGKLLLADNVLTSGIEFLNQSSNYIRYYNDGTMVENEVIYANNYEWSKIRAYLNGLPYYSTDTKTNTNYQYEFENKGFLQTAFSTAAQNIILEKKVTNDFSSILSDDNPNYCKDTYDKIFLTSKYELQYFAMYLKSHKNYPVYSPGTYMSYVENKILIRKATDYALANGVFQYPDENYGCFWFLRTPNNKFQDFVDTISFDGSGYLDGSKHVFTEYIGIVPSIILK